jgi:L-ascorbate metabolism protein UlaG (beta-lactamase superfamily)
MKTDIITTANGCELKISFFGHASIAFEYEGRHVYNDPVSDYADYATLPRADVILVGHEHSDHLDPAAIETLSSGAAPLIIVNATATEALGRLPGAATGATGGEQIQILTHGQTLELPFMTITAVPAWNTSPEKQNFHPRSSLHNGYILTFGGTRVYVAGDGEDTPEMLAMRNVDIAFLPVNLPYTMTEEQAARAIRAIRPAIFYPYHYGGTPHCTDIAKLTAMIDASVTETRIRPLE